MTVLAEKPQAPVAAILSSVDMETPEPYTTEQFTRLTQTYPDLRMEQTKEGEIIIMPPAFTGTGRRNFKISVQLGKWAEVTNTGEGFNSSTGFILPNGAKRSPDTSWVEKSRWDGLTTEQQDEEFSPLCPDFVIELRSKTDRLSTLQKKMREYIENGARLGWLIDPKWKRVEVYRPGQDVQVLENPASVSGDPELPGFVLELREIFA